MCWRSSAVMAFAAAIFVSCSVEAASVGISRSSFLGASGRTSTGQFDLNDEFHTFGLYDQTIGDELIVNGSATRSQASQQSEAGQAIVSGFATGTAAAQVSESDAISAEASSSFLLDFDVVDLAETITFSGIISSTFDGFSRLAVIDNATQVLFERLVDFGEQDELQLDQSLLLAPGRYQLLAEARANGTPSPTEAAFAISYSVTSIPLPAGVWTGFGGLAVAWLVRRRMMRPGRS